MSAALSLALLSVAFAPDAQPAPVGGEFASAVDRAAALPPEEALSCHARDHFDLSGDAAFVWGMGFRVEDAGACCAACAAHRRVCGQARSRGSIFWRTSRGQNHMCSGGRRNACNAWVFCAGDPARSNRCFSYDVHNHTRGECWLKQQRGEATRPKDPFFNHTFFPPAMRAADRASWPFAVPSRIWPGPVPERISWTSGVLAPAEEARGERETARVSDETARRTGKDHGRVPAYFHTRRQKPTDRRRARFGVPSDKCLVCQSGATSRPPLRENRACGGSDSSSNVFCRHARAYQSCVESSRA